MDSRSWERYRDRVESEDPLAPRLTLHRWIDDLLARYAALDAEIAAAVRALGPAEVRVLLDVLALMRARLSSLDDGVPAEDYGQWFTQFFQDLAAGKVTHERWNATDRLSNLLGLSQRAQGLTGFPGFLGTQLLPRVLARDPERTAVCLVQERYRPQAQQRIEELDVTNEGLAKRVCLGVVCPPLRSYVDNLISFYKAHPEIGSAAMI